MDERARIPIFLLSGKLLGREEERERESDGLRENLLKDVVSPDLPRRKVEQASFHERQNF